MFEDFFIRLCLTRKPFKLAFYLWQLSSMPCNFAAKIQYNTDYYHQILCFKVWLPFVGTHRLFNSFYSAGHLLSTHHWPTLNWRKVRDKWYMLKVCWRLKKIMLTGHIWYIQQPLNGPTDLLSHTMSQIQHVAHQHQYSKQKIKKSDCSFIWWIPTRIGIRTTPCECHREMNVVY